MPGFSGRNCFISRALLPSTTLGSPRDRDSGSSSTISEPERLCFDATIDRESDNKGEELSSAFSDALFKLVLGSGESSSSDERTWII
jgi:hypothetical protein